MLHHRSLPFGKYKGKDLLEDVPMTYLAYMLENYEFSEEMQESIEEAMIIKMGRCSAKTLASCTFDHVKDMPFPSSKDELIARLDYFFKGMPS